MKNFRSWKLAFKKAVAAASVRPDVAFIWISQVEKVESVDELSDSGEFPELDALLSTEWDRVTPGEFKKSLMVREFNLAKRDVMIKGRQITWLVYDHFRLSDLDGYRGSRIPENCAGKLGGGLAVYLPAPARQP